LAKDKTTQLVSQSAQILVSVFFLRDAEAKRVKKFLKWNRSNSSCRW